jgi:copper(I)-binding protein
MNFVRICLTAALPVLLAAAPTQLRAQTMPKHAPATAAPSGISVQEAWARAPAGKAATSAAYMTVHTSGAADQLVGVSTPVASKAELHETTKEDGVMKMRPVTSIAIAPGKPAMLAPGGLHVMLMGLTQPLHVGDSFPLTLRFARAAPVTVSVRVVAPGGMKPDAMGHARGH